MVCAYLLDRRHEVTVFERAPILGGNIRTLNGNVPCAGLRKSETVDAGVIEFSPEHFPLFHRLMDRLNVPLHPVPGTTGFLRANGEHYPSIGKLRTSDASGLEKMRQAARVLPLAPQLSAFRRRAARLRKDPARLYALRLDDVLRNDTMSEWLRLLMVYAYSIPRAQIGDIPAALAIPTLLQFTGATRWTAIEGGVYRYIEHILSRIRGEVRTNSDVIEVLRDGTAGGRVSVQTRGAVPEPFDAVIFATTPDRILPTLGDASPAERRRFQAWRGNDAKVLIHHDTGPHRRRGVRDYSEFDVFEEPPGYSAYLNRLCDSRDEGRNSEHIFLSFNQHSEVDPQQVIH